MGKAGGKGRNAGVKVLVIKNDAKQDNFETVVVEKRSDPSDGNGPFEFASFIRFHGEEKGQELWDLAADSAVLVDKKISKKGAGKQKKAAAPDQNNNNKKKNGNKGAVSGDSKKDKAKQLLEQAEAMQKLAAKLMRESKQDGDHKNKKTNTNKGAGKTNTHKGAGKDNKQQGNKKQEAGKGAAGVSKDDKRTKGAGKKGKGAGKGTKGGGEKRLDPSDGNGPFTKASFIKFHGEDKGLQLWSQSAPGQ